MKLTMLINFVKKSFSKVIFYVRVLLFHIVRALEVWLIEDHRDRINFFLERWEGYLVGLFLSYLHLSFVDYLLFTWAPQKEAYSTFFKETGFDQDIFAHFYSVIILFQIYFFISLIFNRIYAEARWAYKILGMIYLMYEIVAYEEFWEILVDFFTSSDFLLMFLYFIFCFGFQFGEFGENMEEDYDNLHVRVSKEALEYDEGWFGNTKYEQSRAGVVINGKLMTDKQQYIERHRRKMTKNDELRAQLFGNFDDYGENPIELFKRYEDHLFKMYGIVQFSEKRRKRIYELKQQAAADAREADMIPYEIDEYRHILTHPLNLELSYMRQNLNYYFFFKEYLTRDFSILYFISIFQALWTIFWYGRFFKPRVVGEYSMWIPYLTNIDPYYIYLDSDLWKLPYFKMFIKTWQSMIKLRYRYAVSLYLSYKKDWFILRGYFWFRFHFKYYRQCLALRKRGTKNYVFFKRKVYVCGHLLIRHNSELWPYL